MTIKTMAGQRGAIVAQGQYFDRNDPVSAPRR